MSVAVTTGNTLIKQPGSWWLLPLAVTGQAPCTALPAHAEPGAYLINERGEPTWLPARATEASRRHPRHR